MITVSAKNTDARYLKGNARPWVEYVTCDKTDECPLYADGKCACYRYLIGMNLTCPNGTWHRLTGPTPRAKSFWDFAANAKKYAPTVEEYKAKLCHVADYVYVPLAYLDMGSRLENVVNGHFIRTEEFDADMVEALVRHNPLDFFGTHIRDYTRTELPKFIQQLKEEMPELYGEWAAKYPKSADLFREVSPIGRTAYISTLPDGCRVGQFVKKGNILMTDGLKSSLFVGNFGSKKPLRVTVEIEPDMTIKVTENVITDENTKFVD